MNLLHFLHRAGMGGASKYRNMFYRHMGMNIQRYSWLRQIEVPRNWGDITLEGCALDRGTILLSSGLPKKDKIKIGSGTYINRHTMIDAHEQIEIGPDCMVGPFCYITDGDHIHNGGNQLAEQGMIIAPVVLEDNVWVGAHATILKGVRIGRHAVIGAGAVVTKDVAAFSTVVGVPARPR